MVDVRAGEVRSSLHFIPWLTTLWLAVMVSWYVRIAFQTVQHPFNPGTDSAWAMAWLALVLAVLGSHALVRRPITTALWLGLLLAGSLTIIVRSGHVAAVLLALWLLALAWSWGAWLLRRLGIDLAADALYRLSLALPLGLGLLMCVALALSLAHVLTTASVILSLLALSLIQAPRTLGKRRLRNLGQIHTRLAISIEEGALLVAMGYTAVLNLIWALAPETQFDALNYHLGVPKIYVAQGGRVDLPYITHAASVRLLDFLFTIPLALHEPITPKLLAFSMGVVTAVEVYLLARTVFGARCGWWAAALVYTTPLVMWLSSTAYTDLGAAMFALASLLALLGWLESRRWAWVWLSALLAALTLAVKPTGMYVLPVMALAIPLATPRENRLSPQAWAKRAVGYSLGLCLASLPLYAVAQVVAKHQVSALLQRGLNRLVPLLTPDVVHRLSAHNLTAGAKLFYTATFEPAVWGEGAPPGVLGAVLLLLPLIVFLISVRSAKVTVLLATGILGTLLWAFARNYVSARYFLPVLPIVVVLVVAAVERMSHTAWQWRLNAGWLTLLLIAQVALGPVQYWQIPERYPYRLALGLETANHFLARALPAYQTVQHLNELAEPGQRVVGGPGMEGIRFYLDAPLTARWEPDVRPQSPNEESPILVAQELHRRGYAYLLVSTQDLPGPPELPFLQLEFVNRFTVPVYSRNGITAYRLLTQAHQHADTPNLLVNPGFETLDAAGYPVGWVPYGQPSVTTTPAHARSGSQAVSADASNWFTQAVPVTSGQVYVIGHFTRSDQRNQRARLQVNWLDQTGQIVDASVMVVLTDTIWTWHALTMIAPEHATTALVYLSVGDAQSQVWFNDVRFAQDVYTGE